MTKEQQSMVDSKLYTRQTSGEASFAGARGSAATSELSEIINAARERGCAEHGHEIKWLLELPMTDAEWKRFNELTGWPSRKQQNAPDQGRRASDSKQP
jgi:hypothetical protein